MYSLRETCEHTCTIVKSSEHGQDLALKPNYPVKVCHYNGMPCASGTDDISTPTVPNIASGMVFGITQ